jgi:hypothetical protein
MLISLQKQATTTPKIRAAIRTLRTVLPTLLYIVNLDSCGSPRDVFRLLGPDGNDVPRPPLPRRRRPRRNRHVLALKINEAGA